MENRLNAFFSREDINTSRQANIDFAKCMAIIFMIICHVFMYPEYRNLSSGFGFVAYAILGGFLAAPVFMISMGVGLSYSRNQDPNMIIKRGIKLFIIGYILNVARSFVPLLIRAASVGIRPILGAFYEGVISGDILHFAGLALILYGFLKKTNIKPIWLFIISLIIPVAFTFIPNINSNSAYVASFCGLFIPIFYEGEILSAFPLFNWFVFVTFGILFGEILRKIKRLDRFYLFVTIIGAILFALFFALENTVILTQKKVGFGNSEYYNPYSFVFFSIGSTMTVYGIFYYLNKITPEKIRNLCFKMSACVNEIYIVSWVIIMDIFYVFARIVFPGDYDMWFYILFGIIITIVSTLLGCLWKELKKRHRAKVGK